MCQLFETIKIDNGCVENVQYHNFRMNMARSAIFGIINPVHIQDYIKVPGIYRTGIIKCRVFYNDKIISVDYEKYNPRPVNSLLMVECNDLEYQYKYLDRHKLDHLFLQKGDKDDVLIIKDGNITDTSIANILFWDGKSWFTPDKPLLCGTRREYLIKTGKITAIQIAHSDLFNYTKAMLINALNGFDESRAFDVKNISF